MVRSKKDASRTSMEGACLYISGTSKNLASLFQRSFILIATFGRRLTIQGTTNYNIYPTLGKWKPSSNLLWARICYVFWRVCTPQLHQISERHPHGMHARPIILGCCCDSMCAKIGTPSGVKKCWAFGESFGWIPFTYFFGWDLGGPQTEGAKKPPCGRLMRVCKDLYFVQLGFASKKDFSIYFIVSGRCPKSTGCGLIEQRLETCWCIHFPYL